ncbi:uncharacterized protein LOC135203631 isoform X2 [Macrobrachium nipponense]|uniref:uncharacterized protein LOC135203631 isoform X2 n=1 Tax=Macrobrachium nipponense TaxID=159736 RepID=UPI0030C83D34
MGGNFGDSAAKEPGSILIEDSGVNNVRAHRGTTGTLDDAGEAPGGSSSGNFLQTEQVNHLKDAIIKEDTMAPKSETVPGIAPSTSETPDDVKPVTQNKVNLKHPIGEAAGERLCYLSEARTLECPQVEVLLSCTGSHQLSADLVNGDLVLWRLSTAIMSRYPVISADT